MRGVLSDSLRVIKDLDEMRAFSSEVRSDGKTIVLVPTMGALHRGHLELVKTARSLADIIVLTIFVNPRQFSSGEDLEVYPRDLENDLENARAEGVDVVFRPSASDMYPQGFQTEVSLRGFSKKLCGLSRPGHFTGVATVVLKLFNITEPHSAVFGEKDYQQLLVIKQMIEDLNLAINITGVATVRDSDGLALSSRNAYLNDSQRRAAAALPRSLNEARRLYESGESSAAVIISAVEGVLRGESLAEVEYVKVVDGQTLEDLDVINRGGNKTLVQAVISIGRARLIDHVLL